MYSSLVKNLDEWEINIRFNVNYNKIIDMEGLVLLHFMYIYVVR